MAQAGAQVAGVERHKAVSPRVDQMENVDLEQALQQVGDLGIGRARVAAAAAATGRAEEGAGSGER